MRFDCLLWQCLRPGLYEKEDALIRAALRPEAGETVLMFEPDSDEFRGGKAGGKACDLLFFYVGRRSAVPVLLFVELKGSRPEVKAYEQIVKTFNAVVSQLHSSCTGVDPAQLASDPSQISEKHVLVRSVVVLGEAAPQQTKQDRQRLFDQYRLTFEYRHNLRDGSVTDLRDSLP